MDKKRYTPDVATRSRVYLFLSNTFKDVGNMLLLEYLALDAELLQGIVLVNDLHQIGGVELVILVQHSHAGVAGNALEQERRHAIAHA